MWWYKILIIVLLLIGLYPDTLAVVCLYWIWELTQQDIRFVRESHEMEKGYRDKELDQVWEQIRRICLEMRDKKG